MTCEGEKEGGGRRSKKIDTDSDQVHDEISSILSFKFKTEEEASPVYQSVEVTALFCLRSSMIDG